MIRNVQWTRDAPAHKLEPARKDPVGMHAESGAAPGRRACGNRRRVTTRFEKAARLDALFTRQGVEVAHDDCWTGHGVRLICDHFELGQLTVARSVRVDVRVE